jgi:hypothetical protein
MLVGLQPSPGRRRHRRIIGSQFTAGSLRLGLVSLKRTYGARDSRGSAISLRCLRKVFGDSCDLMFVHGLRQEGFEPLFDTVEPNDRRCIFHNNGLAQF